MTYIDPAAEQERRDVLERLVRAWPGRSKSFYRGSIEKLFLHPNGRPSAGAAFVIEQIFNDDVANTTVVVEKDPRRGGEHLFPGDSDPAERRVVYTTEDPHRRVLNDREASRAWRSTRSPVLAPTNAWDFLASRARWLEVNLTEHSPGSFNVTLRLDGSYSDSEDGRAMAEEMADHMRDTLRSIMLTAAGGDDR